MAYLPLVEKPKGVLQRYAFRYSRKQFGKVVEPVQAVAHHSGVTIASGALEMAVARGWHALDPSLRWLAIQATSAAIGCSWCIDYGYYESVQRGADPRKVRDVTRWQDSDVYDDKERLVLEYTAAVNTTPSSVTDGLAARLREHFSEKEIAALTSEIAMINMWNRVAISRH